MKIDNTKISSQIDVQKKEQVKEQIATQRAVQITDEDLRKASQCIMSSRLPEISFKKRIPAHQTVSKEDLQKLIDEKKSRDEICEELNITLNQYTALLKKYEIVTPRMLYKENTAKVTKEVIEDLLNQGKAAKEICEILGISKSTYDVLLDRFGIITNYQISKHTIAQITPEKLEEMVAQGKTSEDIAQELGISSSSCRNYFKKFGIKTESISNRENVSSITKEQLETLINSGKGVPEICSELNIGRSTYSRLLQRFGIETAQKASMKKNSEITKEQLQSVVDRDLSIKEACEELGISKSTYHVLLTKYGIKTKKMLNDERVNSITEEQFRALLDSGLTCEQIQKELQISVKFYYTLMRKFNIEVKKYDVKSNDKELVKNIEELLAKGESPKDIAEKLNITEDMCRYALKKLGYVAPKTELLQRKAEITKEQLLEQLAKGKSTKENYEELGLTESSYYSLLSQHGIKTEAQKLRENAASVTISQVKSLLAGNKSLPEICKELNISETSFYRILAQNNVQTVRQQNIKQNRTISKEVLSDLINQGKTIKEICEELKISPKRYNYLKFIYNLTTPAKKEVYGKTYEQYTVDELKEKLINLFIDNDVVNQNNMLSSLVDYVSDKKDYTDDTKVDLIELVKLIEKVVSNQVDELEISSFPIVKNITIQMVEEQKRAQERQEQFEILLAQYYGILENLLQHNMSNTTAIGYKYMPVDIDDENVKFIESVVEMVKSVSDGSGSAIEQLNKIKRNLIYMDAEKDSSARAEIEEATKYCQKLYQKTTPELVGQYIENKRIYENYLETEDVIEYPKDFVELVKEKTGKFNDSVAKEMAISYMIKLDNWFNSDMSETNYINDFLKIFSTDRLVDNAIIQHFIENIYTQEDTQAVAIGQNGRTQDVTLASKAKKSIYNRHKYPNSLRYLCAFEEALQQFAATSGSTGIKIENVGLRRMKLKVIGMPDRIFSTNNDFCFDDYSPSGDH